MDIDTRRLANDEVYRKAIATQMGVDDVEVRPEKLDPRERLWRAQVEEKLFKVLCILDPEQHLTVDAITSRHDGGWYLARLTEAHDAIGAEIDRVSTGGDS